MKIFLVSCVASSLLAFAFSLDFAHSFALGVAVGLIYMVKP